jgi:hypothetical protein
VFDIQRARARARADEEPLDLLDAGVREAAISVAKNIVSPHGIFAFSVRHLPPPSLTFPRISSRLPELCDELVALPWFFSLEKHRQIFRQ